VSNIGVIDSENKLTLPWRYSCVRHTHVTEEIKKTISRKQAEVQDAITTANKQLVILEDKMHELAASSNGEEAAPPVEGKAEVLRQLEKQIKGLDASRKLLDELLSKLKEEVVTKAAGNQSSSITMKFGDHNGGFQAGTIAGDVSGISFGRK
jgi:predicted unusual protein kinase regulating ubiquinone biosynthesis (AarF/ABC1/UbiB family)